MIRKLLYGLMAVVVLLCAAGAVAWQVQGDAWRAEYAAYRKTGAPVLMYHAVGNEYGPDWPQSLIMRPELFEEHLRYLKEQGYIIVSVEQLAHRLEKGESVDKYVALSFDDGYKNNHSVALPIMQKYDAKGSFFVINKEMGDKEHMNEAEIKEMLAAGMELGSHTYSHAPLAKIDTKYLVWELDTSRYWLKKKFDGYIVRTLAYPNGSYNKTVIEAAKKYGFYRALTGHIGLNTAATYKAAPMEMYRVTVTDDGNGLEGFKRRLEQAYFFGFLQTKGIDINPVRDLFASY
ncbi:MAG: polysaccharide deacetylase family protein [Phascolarctobacterium sp.]|nr:polysaccharide deacetylase family protein [Phascolarctobacterium sp.]